MRLSQFRCMWGVVNKTDGILARSPHPTMRSALPAIKALGYEGCELPLKMILDDPDIPQMMADNGLKMSFVIFSDGPAAPGHEIPLWGGPYDGFTEPAQPGDQNAKRVVDKHVRVFKEQVELAQKHAPAYINSHSAKDFFTVNMATDFFSEALEYAPDVLHECHRGRFLHSPWLAREFLPQFPQLKMTADLSHWINLAETNTEDPDLNRVIESCAHQVHHTHCRVGYEHGPQVADPRAPEWLPYMEGHERWWDTIWAAADARGDEVVTMIAEHGPPTYQQCNPYSKEPLAHIWDVNHWVSLRRQERFAQLYGKENTSSLVPSETQGYEPPTAP